MKRPFKKTSLFWISGVISLMLGGMIYVFYRPNTYVFNFFREIPLPRQSFLFLDVPWIKYYFADYLWAYSLCCGLHLIFQPQRTGSFLLAGITVLFGSTFEFLQYAGVLSGTGDLWDVLMFILAGFTVNMINLYYIRRE